MFELSLTDLILVSAILGFSGFIHGVFGLGFPMIATPLLAMFMDVQSAVLITLFPTMAVNALSIYKGGDWKDSIGRFWPLALCAGIGSMLGANLLVMFDPSPFRLALAAIIVLYLCLPFLTRLKMSWIESNMLLSTIGFGVVAGMFGGSVNVMVPILMIFTLELGLARRVMIQTFNMCFMTGKGMQVVVFAFAGLVGMDLIITMLPGLMLAVVSLLLGAKIQNRIESAMYQKIMKGILLLMAVILVVQFFLGK